MAGEAVSLHSLLANRNCKVYRQNFEANDFPSGAVNLFKDSSMENRSLALRYLSDAVSMDSSGNYQVAFAKYLQSLNVLSLYLNEMFASFGFQKMLERNKEVKQVLSMIHECSDRMTVIVDGGKKESPKNTIPKKNSVSNVQPCSDFTNTYTKKFPAFEKLENDNMALIKRYQWRFEKATDKNAKANLKLELERQLIENDLIAKKKYNEVSFLILSLI
ncbi:uncharacterized protein TNCV_450011 [Trichonephila clavipes]|nr:uncharacterized protein TNCV_450011 [Trichonephila clavipes]